MGYSSNECVYCYSVYYGNIVLPMGSKKFSCGNCYEQMNPHGRLTFCVEKFTRFSNKEKCFLCDGIGVSYYMPLCPEHKHVYKPLRKEDYDNVDKPEITVALNILRKHLEDEEGIKHTRLRSVVSKLERFMSCKYDDPDDLTKQEKYEKGLNSFVEYILSNDSNCEDYRSRIINSGDYSGEYLENDIPFDYETFVDLVTSESCFCGKCD